MCTFGLSKRAIRVQRQRHHPHSTRRHPEKHPKSEMVAGEGKETAKFWAPHPSGLHPSGLHPSGLHLSGFGGPTPSFGAPPFGAPKSVCSTMHFFILLFLFFFEKEGLKTETPKSAWSKSATQILAKVDKLRLAKVGQKFLAKVGLAKVDQIGLAKVGISRDFWSVILPTRVRKDQKLSVRQSTHVVSILGDPCGHAAPRM